MYMNVPRKKKKWNTKKKSTTKTTVRTHFYNKHSRRSSVYITQQRRVRERKCTVFLKSLYVCGTSEKKINIIITIYLSTKSSSVMSFIFFLVENFLRDLSTHQLNRYIFLTQICFRSMRMVGEEKWLNELRKSSFVIPSPDFAHTHLIRSKKQRKLIFMSDSCVLFFLHVPSHRIAHIIVRTYMLFSLMIVFCVLCCCSHFSG